MVKMYNKISSDVRMSTNLVTPLEEFCVH